MKKSNNRHADKPPNVLDIKLSTRGRFTLPKPMRDALGWRAGTVLDVERVGDAVRFRRRPEASGREAEKGRGSRS